MHFDSLLADDLVHKLIIKPHDFDVIVLPNLYGDLFSDVAGGVIVPALLREMGCEVIEMNCEVSGVFSHTPEPIPENLTDLAGKVRTEKADLGIAVDPDVDRLVFIDEKGEPYGEEYTIATAVKFVLEREKQLGHACSQSVVVNLSTTRAVEDIAVSYGATCLRTPVGKINVAKTMKQVGAVIGGEGSGRVILPAVHLGRDAIVGIGLILQHARAILGLPVDVSLREHGASAVIYGGMEGSGIAYDGVAEALAWPCIDLRLFGKPQASVRRRMGVALATAASTEEARLRAKAAAAAVKPVKL